MRCGHRRGAGWREAVCGVLLTVMVAACDTTETTARTDESLATLTAVAHSDRPEVLPPLAVRVAFSPDGRLLATSGDAVRLWDVTTRRQTVAEFGGRAHLIAFVSNDTLVTVTADTVATKPDTVRVWDTTTGAQRRTLPDASYSPRFRHTARYTAAAVSPDSRMLALAGYGQVLLWDLATGELVGDPMGNGHVGPSLKTLAFSPDGRLLATGDRDGTVRLWDIGSRKPYVSDMPCRGILGGQQGLRPEGWIFGIEALAFSPDGRTLAAACETTDVYGVQPERRDGAVQAWDVTGRTPAVRWVTGSRDRVNVVSFAPDGRTLATGGADMRVRWWDAASGNAVGQPLAGHEVGISDLAYHPTQPLVATGSWDGTARLWPVSG
ncbi:WD40 repeat domain-containing protein [Micromonospora sp. CPCC 205371]|nr:WD40 repeat domain-containing protein [Micromonospora sp. CPCC 205371]